VSLTEAGDRFLLRCRRLQDDRDEALAAMADDDADELRGQLRMTCAVAYGEQFLAPLINEIMTDNPRLSVDLILTDQVLDIVEEGIDLAVRFGRLRDSRLIATRLASRMRLLCASPTYIQRHGAPSRLEDLAHHACLRGLADVWSFTRDGQSYLHRPHGPFRCNSGYSVLQAALSHLGLCQLPDFYVRPYSSRGELLELLAEHRPEDEGVWAVYPDRRHLPAKVKVVIERLHAALSRLEVVKA
jgi:DNA-binding transcriptional LysR family regulator